LSFEKLSSKYVGATAEHYDRVRAGRKWDSEHEAIEQLLAHVPDGSRVLDIPVGTGRLLPYFKARRFETFGMDVSTDMLSQAEATAEMVGGKVRLEQSDIRSVPYADGAFDLVVCLRFLNMIDAEELKLVLAELSRLSCDKLLLGIRYVTPLSDVRPSSWDIVRLAFRPILTARKLGRRLIGPRSDIILHRKDYLIGLLSDLHLKVGEIRYIERRWDNTDYVLLLLQR
jgi:SAM-dependent methyltransferase